LSPQENDHGAGRLAAASRARVVARAGATDRMDRQRRPLRL